MTVISSLPSAVLVPSVKRKCNFTGVEYGEQERKKSLALPICDCVGSIKVGERFREINIEPGLTE
jgi:hypothetical protein